MRDRGARPALPGGRRFPAARLLHQRRARRARGLRRLRHHRARLRLRRLRRHRRARQAGAGAHQRARRDGLDQPLRRERQHPARRAAHQGDQRARARRARHAGGERPAPPLGRAAAPAALRRRGLHVERPDRGHDLGEGGGRAPPPRRAARGSPALDRRAHPAAQHDARRNGAGERHAPAHPGPHPQRDRMDPGPRLEPRPGDRGPLRSSGVRSRGLAGARLEAPPPGRRRQRLGRGGDARGRGPGERERSRRTAFLGHPGVLRLHRRGDGTGRLILLRRSSGTAARERGRDSRVEWPCRRDEAGRHSGARCHAGQICADRDSERHVGWSR